MLNKLFNSLRKQKVELLNIIVYAAETEDKARRYLLALKKENQDQPESFH